jgi:membrane dipeptidase
MRVLSRRSILQMLPATALSAAQTDRASRLHRDSVVINAHDHMWRRSDYDDMRRGGVTAKIYKPMADGMYFDDRNRRVFPGAGFDWTGKYLERMSTVEASGGTIIRTLSDLDAVKLEGKAGVILGNEGTLPLGGSVRALEMLYSRGLRETALYWPAGKHTSHVINEKGLLTPFGLGVIENANRLGIVLDSAHLTGLPAFHEALKESKAPLLHSHGGAKNPRGWTFSEGDLEDAHIRAIAESGGVIGLHFCTYIKNAKGWNWTPTIEDLMDHVDYIVRVGGIECLGIGADHFPYNSKPLASPVQHEGENLVEDRDWGQTFVAGLENISAMPEFTRGLVGRSYTDDQIRKILGQNVIRVLKQAWKN